MSLCAQVLAAIVLPSVGFVPGTRVRLLSSETLFREAFSRFPNDELNGYSTAKLERLGQEAEILQEYSDRTVTCRFDDGVRHDMPIEALSHSTAALSSVSARTSNSFQPDVDQEHTENFTVQPRHGPSKTGMPGGSGPSKAEI